MSGNKQLCSGSVIDRSNEDTCVPYNDIHDKGLSVLSFVAHRSSGGCVIFVKWSPFSSFMIFPSPS
jgi:hypothetical protein